MSFNVLVVAEDPTYNGYILKPLVQRILEDCGKQNAQVFMFGNPRTTGYETAKNLLRNVIIKRDKHYDLILFLPDQDGCARKGELDALEAEAQNEGVNLFCCAAVEEVEVWLLAGHLNKLSKPWKEIRNNNSVKEQVFNPFLKRHGNPKSAGGGREELMREALKNFSGILNKCDEFENLKKRICDFAQRQ